MKINLLKEIRQFKYTFVQLYIEIFVYTFPLWKSLRKFAFLILRNTLYNVLGSNNIALILINNHSITNFIFISGPLKITKFILDHSGKGLIYIFFAFY